MAVKPELERAAYSPGEFAKKFGKSQTWGYRQIYDGKVKAITNHGRILIPAAEVDAILKTAGIYDGMKPKAVNAKNAAQPHPPDLRNVWQSFLAARRQSKQPKISKQEVSALKKMPSSPLGRRAVLARLVGQKGMA